MRIKAAFALAALYAFCVLAPSAALALSDAAKRVHCLTSAHDIAAGKHDSGQPHGHGHGVGTHHADGTGLTHGDASDESDRAAGKCCGMFCIAALADEPTLALIPPPLLHADYRLLDDPVRGRGPDRIIRPPIA